MNGHPVRQRVQNLFRLLIFAAIIAGLVGAGQKAVASGGAGELAKVYFHSEQELNQLATRLDVWEVHRPQGTLLALVSPAQFSDLQSAGWQVELAETPALPAAGIAEQQSGSIPGFPCYRTLAQTYIRMQALAAQYPALAQVVNIGVSWEKASSSGTGGYDILALKLTNQTHPGPKPVFFLMAEIHARELATAETALRFAEYLLGAYGVNPDVTWLLDDYEVEIVPMTNPDGRKMVETNLESYWRKNTDNANGCTTLPYYGTDLNRNFSFAWNTGGSSAEACDETYRGPSAASEPEVQALQGYLAALFPGGAAPTPAQPAPADTSGLLLTLHSYGGMVLWPYGSPQPAPNQAQLQTLGSKLAYFNGYLPEQSYELYQTSGTTDDWLYGTLGVPAYTFEMGSEFYETCPAFEATVWPNNRAALLYAFKSARRPYQSPGGPDISTASIPVGPVNAGLTVTFTATADTTRSNSPNGSEPPGSIQSARASLDTPSWAAGTVSFSVAAADGSFDSSIESLRGTLDTTGIAPGRHTLFIEAQDSAGNWGAPTAVFLDVAPTAFGVSITPTVGLLQALPGRMVRFRLTITNLGSLPDNFDLSANNTSSWNISFPLSAGPLQPGASTHVSVTVGIPLGAAAGEASLIQFTARSQAQPTSRQTIALQAGALHGYYLALVFK